MNPIVPLGIAAALGTGLYLFEKKKLPGQKAGASSKGSGFTQASFAQSSMSVKDVQHALNVLGASPSLVEDGQAGPHTTAAIQSFQSQAGITSDGVVGPQTVAAIQHALGGHDAVAGLYDIESLAEEAEMEGSPSMVAGPWFVEHDLYEGGHGGFDEEESIEHVGQTMAHLSGVNRRAASARGYNVVGQRGRSSARGARGAATQQSIGPQQGYDESSNNWCAPDISQIMNDPLQQQQIGIQELYRQKAEAAFGPGTSAGYDYSFLPDQGQGALALATAELGGSSLGGTSFTSGDYEEEEELEHEMVGQMGQDWSAPDISEAYRDPEQVAEMVAHSMPYGYGLPYQAMPPQPQNTPMWGYQQGYGNMPSNEPFQGPYPYPGGYPFGPMNAPTAITPPVAQLGGVQMGMAVNPATMVPGQGYQFQSQQGRFF